MGAFSIWRWLILAVMLGIVGGFAVAVRVIVRALRKPRTSKP